MVTRSLLHPRTPLWHNSSSNCHTTMQGCICSSPGSTPDRQTVGPTDTQSHMLVVVVHTRVQETRQLPAAGVTWQGNALTHCRQMLCRHAQTKCAATCMHFCPHHKRSTCMRPVPSVSHCTLPAAHPLPLPTATSQSEAQKHRGMLS